MFQYLLPMIKIMGNIRTLNKTKIKDFFLPLSQIDIQIKRK